jgi:uncharacterized protein YdeI (YjbR/CyaY-like superfamily)
MPEREAVFFRTPAEWRAWLEAHAAKETELWVGFHKRGSVETGISWPESVDPAEALDASRYRIRFSPRKARSIWSTVNIARVAELDELGLMQRAGMEAFARRQEARSGVYSHEQAGEPELEAEQQALLESRPEAWRFFQAQAPSYRKAALWWVVNAKRAETRSRRLGQLIEDSAARRRLAHLRRPGSAL